MTLDDLTTDLRALEQLLVKDRIEIWRVIVDKHGRELRRIYRGSFQRPHEPHKERKTR
jgi:hypothetical protein